MIFVNPDHLKLSAAWEGKAKALAQELLQKPANERAAFIEENREATWADAELITALRNIIGNKCWYSEVPLEGADPNVDHFRPKGRVREVDMNLQPTKATWVGYWWLAFDSRNYRLVSMHSNQRRVDKDTQGGKWDFFPIRGARAPEGTDCGAIHEDALALDPCLLTDVRLLWFDPDGKPGISRWKDKAPSPLDEVRVRATIWLYHLDKVEIQARRTSHVQDIRKDLRKADADYQLWGPHSAAPDLQAKHSFDKKVAEIKTKTSDTAEFAGAKRCAVRAAVADYPWLEEFNIL